MGIFGGSKSKTKQVVTNNTVNQTFVDTLNKTMLDASVETLVKNANACSTSVDQTNQCKVTDAKIAGDFNLNATQTNIAKVNFSCVQETQASTDMKAAMAQTMISQVESLNGTDSATNLNAKASAYDKSGSFSLAKASATTSTSANVSNNVTNETIDTITNIFEQNISNNFTSDTVSECIGRTSQSSSVDVEGVKIGGTANIGCDQTNSVDVVQECKQLTNAINKTTGEVFNELGLSVVAENITETTTVSKMEAKSESITTSFTQDLWNGISGGINAIGNALGPFGGGPSSFMSSIIIILVLVFGGVFYISQAGGSQDNYGIETNSYRGGGFDSGVYFSETDLSGSFRSDYVFGN